MPRIARAVAVGYPHHIAQRGNYRQTVFESDEDYIRYLDWLTVYSRKYWNRKRGTAPICDDDADIQCGQHFLWYQWKYDILDKLLGATNYTWDARDRLSGIRTEGKMVPALDNWLKTGLFFELPLLMCQDHFTFLIGTVPLSSILFFRRVISRSQSPAIVKKTSSTT